METLTPTNPVSNFYKNYVFNTSLPIVKFNNYTDLLKQAPTVNKSCILLNTTKQQVSTPLNIKLSYPKNLEVILVLNVDFIDKAILDISGDNYSISNISFLKGNSSYNYPTHLIYI